jgi:myosin V
VANFEANKDLYMTSNGSEMDVSLISKLNRRIASLEMEKRQFTQGGSGSGRNATSASTNGLIIPSVVEQDNNNNINDLSEAEKFERIQQEKDYEMIKSQELEFENQKLKEDLTRLRDFVSENQQTGSKSESIINKEMINQFDALNEEVQRRREECIQLKSLLIAKHRASFHNNNDHSSSDEHNNIDDINSLNTDGNEFEVGYNTQKILNRILENQMFELKKTSETEKVCLQKEMSKLREENERQQNLLLQNLSPESLAEATYKNEIVKLADNNLVNFFFFYLFGYF